MPCLSEVILCTLSSMIKLGTFLQMLFRVTAMILIALISITYGVNGKIYVLFEFYKPEVFSTANSSRKWFSKRYSG